LFGPSALPRFPELLWRKLDEGGRVYEILDATGEIAEDLPVRREGIIKAFLPIMYGCNNFCTYCVVPLVRGRERSRDHEKVLAEALELIENGYKDITLLGQNVNSYHSGDVDFVELLRRLDNLPGQFRLRFMTSHPKDCTEALIDVMAVCDKVVNHLHLPVQSGSNRILALMNRRYTVEQYRSIIAYAKRKIPGITFTSDVIVGFPGETYEDVCATMALIREVGYQSLFTFLYSKRVGTRAADMPDTATAEEKGAWFRELLELQNTISAEQYATFVGKTLEVLVDDKGREEGELSGRTASNIIVKFSGDEGLVGSFVPVKITEALHWAVAGEIVG
jgi:tRNA-2-methylthio-N6-dimethylallyladenosine synthase